MRGAWLPAAGVALSLLVMTRVTSAHKPITSPFTYTADVRPILRDRCSRCHAPAGVAPMSLLTYQDAVPWGESMRAELAAGHMPPWRVDRGAGHIHTQTALTARELNVLLTWITGGAPPGDLAAEPEPSPLAPAWPLGQPDAVLDLPAFTLAADDQEHVATFTVPAGGSGRALRAIDLLPGTPAIVRSATVEVQGGTPGTSAAIERKLALWVPGDDPMPLSLGTLRLPAHATLTVRVRYRRTWSYEGKPMTDRSRVGMYFAAAPEPAVEAITLSPERPATMPRAARAVAVYTDGDIGDAAVVVTAATPQGRRQELIAFHQRSGWTRRFWFSAPVTLSRGTTLSVRVAADPPSLFPGGLRAASTSKVVSRPAAQVTLNVVP